MNETLKIINERYTCRDFKDTPLKQNQIDELVKAALAAPSAMNLQPWHIIMVMDKDLIDELDDEGMKIVGSWEDKSTYDRFKERGGKLFYNAPALMLILSDGSTWGTLDCGILCQNVVIAAESMGLGTCIVGMAGVPLNGPRADEYRKTFKFPEGHTFAIGILFGEIKSGKEPHEHDTSRVTFIN